MTQMNPAILAAIAAAAKTEDHTKVVKGGGERKIAAEGPCFGRLVGYLELGKVNYEYQGKPKVKDVVELTFELFGAKHAPTILDDGRKIPVTISVKVNKGQSDNGAWVPLMNRLNWSKDITIAPQALGRAYKLKVVHSKPAKEGDPIYANINEGKNFFIDPPRKEVTDDDTGDVTYQDVTVPEALSPLRCFLWNYPDMDQWNALFIDGTYEEKKDDAGNITAPARSKNRYQEQIKAAANFAGSPICDLLMGGGDALGDIDVDKIERKPEDVQAGIEAKAGNGAAADPLADIG